jgi:hypothetical protein
MSGDIDGIFGGINDIADEDLFNKEVVDEGNIFN